MGDERKRYRYVQGSRIDSKTKCTQIALEHGTTCSSTKRYQSRSVKHQCKRWNMQPLKFIKLQRKHQKRSGETTFNSEFCFKVHSQHMNTWHIWVCKLQRNISYPFTAQYTGPCTCIAKEKIQVDRLISFSVVWLQELSICVQDRPADMHAQLGISVYLPSRLQVSLVPVTITIDQLWRPLEVQVQFSRFGTLQDKGILKFTFKYNSCERQDAPPYVILQRNKQVTLAHEYRTKHQV